MSLRTAWLTLAALLLAASMCDAAPKRWRPSANSDAADPTAVLTTAAAAAAAAATLFLTHDEEHHDGERHDESRRHAATRTPAAGASGSKATQRTNASPGARELANANRSVNNNDAIIVRAGDDQDQESDLINLDEEAEQTGENMFAGAWLIAEATVKKVVEFFSDTITLIKNRTNAVTRESCCNEYYLYPLFRLNDDTAIVYGNTDMPVVRWVLCAVCPKGEDVFDFKTQTNNLSSCVAVQCWGSAFEAADFGKRHRVLSNRGANNTTFEWRTNVDNYDSLFIVIIQDVARDKSFPRNNIAQYVNGAVATFTKEQQEFEEKMQRRVQAGYKREKFPLRLEYCLASAAFSVNTTRFKVILEEVYVSTYRDSGDLSFTAKLRMEEYLAPLFVKAGMDSTSNKLLMYAQLSATQLPVDLLDIKEHYLRKSDAAVTYTAIVSNFLLFARRAWWPGGVLSLRAKIAARTGTIAWTRVELVPEAKTKVPERRARDEGGQDAEAQLLSE